jgi:hypothetical protein
MWLAASLDTTRSPGDAEVATSLKTIPRGWRDRRERGMAEGVYDRVLVRAILS